jgi:hypothetical protein
VIAASSVVRAPSSIAARVGRVFQRDALLGEAQPRGIGSGLCAGCFDRLARCTLICSGKPGKPRRFGGRGCGSGTSGRNLGLDGGKWSGIQPACEAMDVAVDTARREDCDLEAEPCGQFARHCDPILLRLGSGSIGPGLGVDRWRSARTLDRKDQRSAEPRAQRAPS